MTVELTVHHKHVIPLFRSRMYVGILSHPIGRVEIHHIAVLIGLLTLYQSAVFLKRIEFALGILHKAELHRRLAEFFIRQHSILDEYPDVVPLVLEVLTVGLEDLFQTRRHLLGDISGDLLHRCIRLQIRTRHIERYVGGIYHTLQKHHEVRHHALHRIGHIHLIAVELYAVFVHLEVVFDLREKQHTGKRKRIVDIQMYPEQRIFLTRIQLVVEIAVVLVGEVGRLFGPCRLGVVNHLVTVGIHHLAVLPLLFLARHHRHWQEAAVFSQQRVYFTLLQEIFILVIDMQYYIGAAFGLVGFLHREFRRAVTFPPYGLRTLFVRQRTDLHLLGYHKRRVKPEAEMTDYGIGVVLVFLKKLFCPRKCYLIDIFIYILSRHTYAVVAHCESAGIGVDTHLHFHVAKFTLELSERRQSAQLLGGVDCIRHQFTQKYFVIAVEKFFDYGEDIFGGYPDFTFLSIHRFL